MADENPFLFRNSRKQYLTGVLHNSGEIKNRPVLVMAHGFTDDKVCDNRIFVRFARRASEKGYVVLRFDFAGSGDSEGEFADVTITGEIQDLESAIEFAHSLPLLAESPIYLVGYSLGGAVALSAAAQNGHVSGVVGWAPVSDPEAVFLKMFGEETFLTARKRQVVACRNDSKHFLLKSGFFFDLAQHQPVRDIQKMSPRPVLLIQGTADIKVLPEQTRALYEAAREPKALHVIHSAPHSFAFHEDELFEITLKHLDAWSRDAWYLLNKIPVRNQHPKERA